MSSRNREAIDQLAAARRVAAGWGRAVGSRPMCIEATRYGIEALGRLGIQARPMPCSILVLTRFAHSLAARGVPVSDWPPWAHSVGVHPDLRPDQPAERGWNGHLVVEGDDFIADLTLGAFSRPQRGLVVRPWAWSKNREIRCHNNQWVALSDAVAVVIEPRPELARWRHTPAWRRPPRQDIVDFLVSVAEPRTGL